MLASYPLNGRETIFITHAAPEDNQFALWLSAKLALAGYRVWVDRNRLRGGHDFWDEIERVLRTEAVKQIVVFTANVRKSGVKKELALGEVMKAKLDDANFMIGIRNDLSEFGDAPPELLRGNILNAFPNWHDCLKDLIEALDQYGVPRDAGPDAALLNLILAAREDGRRFVINTPEAALTNWFPINPPERIRYFRFDGLQEHMQAWRRECRVPHVNQGRLTASFADPVSFLAASAFEPSMVEAYDLPFSEFIDGSSLGPYGDRNAARRDVSNLLRQHFNNAASDRGLLPFEFANGETGGLSDGLIPGNKVTCQAPDGRRIRRSVSGKFKAMRWHLCLVAKPRIWPFLVYRLHANIVLSIDGRSAMSGDKTHARRRRLTRSWWNDVWRDRLLAGMSFLAEGKDTLAIKAGATPFSVAAWPLLADLPVSYEATDAPLPSEEDEDGNIVPSAELDDRSDDLDEAIGIEDFGGPS